MISTILALMLLAAPVSGDVGAGAETDDPIPRGAPKDDFAFVAWCDGVLAGHMDLAQRVQSVLPLDPEQEKIGHAYLEGYEKALAKSPEGRTEAGHQRAIDARAIGWNNWDQARNADAKLAADTYLAWQLPGRCEHVAIRLSGDKDLFRMAPTVEEAQAMGVSTPVAGAQAAQQAEADRAAPPPPAAAGDDVPAEAVKINTLPDAPKLPGEAAPADAPAPPSADPKPKKKGWWPW
jgi:hypothetical protein